MRRDGDGKSVYKACSDITSPSGRLQLPVSQSSRFFGQMECWSRSSVSTTPIDFELFVVRNFFVIVNKDRVVKRA